MVECSGEVEKKWRPLSARTLRFLCLQKLQSLANGPIKVVHVKGSILKFLKIRGIDSIDIIESIRFDRVTPAAVIASHLRIHHGISGIRINWITFQPCTLPATMKPMMIHHMALANKPRLIAVLL